MSNDPIQDARNKALLFNSMNPQLPATCPTCGGNKIVPVPPIPSLTGHRTRNLTDCPDCHGTGYVASMETMSHSMSTEPGDHISYCRNCCCMTKTIKDKCGKCGAVKTYTKPEISIQETPESIQDTPTDKPKQRTGDAN